MQYNCFEVSMKTKTLKTLDKVNIAINHYENGFDFVLIVMPGWFMTKDSESFLEMCKVFGASTDVIGMDFRGHGKSGGFYTFTSRELLDVRAVVHYARKFYKKIYLIGFSLGASLALLYGSMSKFVDKIVAVSPASDFDKIENHFWKKEAWIPTFRKMELKRWISIRPSIHIQRKIKPIMTVDKIKVPTLFVAGENDPTVFPWHTRRLYEKATCKKDFVLFEDCNHAEDLFLAEKEKFVKICGDWLFSDI